MASTFQYTTSIEVQYYARIASDVITFCVSQASVDWDGRPRLNTIRDNYISDPVEGKGVAVTGSDYNYVLNNTFVGIDSLRFDDAKETLVTGNALPSGVSFNLDDGATLADGSQSPTD